MSLLKVGNVAKKTGLTVRALAQKFAKRSLELIDMFTAGDPGIRQSLNNMYATEGGENILNQQGMDVDKAFFAHVSKAMELAKKK